MPSIVSEPLRETQLPQPLDERERSKLIIAQRNHAKTLAIYGGMSWSLCSPDLRKTFLQRSGDMLMGFAMAIGDRDLLARLREIQ